jgi:hypothetical protein
VYGRILIAFCKWGSANRTPLLPHPEDNSCESRMARNPLKLAHQKDILCLNLEPWIALGKIEQKGSLPPHKQGNLCVRSSITSAKGSTGLVRPNRPLLSDFQKRDVPESICRLPKKGGLQQRCGAMPSAIMEKACTDKDGLRRNVHAQCLGHCAAKGIARPPPRPYPAKPAEAQEIEPPPNGPRLRGKRPGRAQTRHRAEAMALRRDPQAGDIRASLSGVTMRSRWKEGFDRGRRRYE